MTLPLFICSSFSTEFKSFFSLEGDSEDKCLVSELRNLGFFTTVPLNASRRRGEVSVLLFFTRRHIVAMPTRYTSKKHYCSYQYCRKAGNFSLACGITLSQDKTLPASLPLQKLSTRLYYAANEKTTVFPSQRLFLVSLFWPRKTLLHPKLTICLCSVVSKQFHLLL